jgi:PAS domain S-box-containing protein
MKEESRDRKLLQAITKAHTDFIDLAEPKKLFEGLLQLLLSVTESEYGFIAEMLHDSENQPYLKMFAITNISWNEETRRIYEDHAVDRMEFHSLKTLFGHVMVTREPVISNHPGTDSRRGGLAEGHPPLNAFLGLPISLGNSMIGMAGIANRPGGYDNEIVSFLQPFLLTCGDFLRTINTDIKRRDAENALKDSEATVRALLESASQAVLAVDTEGNIVFSNPMAEEMFGYNANELAKMTVDTLLPDRLRKTHAEHRALFFAEPRVRPMGQGRELSACRKDGSEISIEISLGYIDAPDGMLAVTFATDITERKRVRRDRRKQARMTALADGLLQGQEEERRRIARELHDSASQDLAMVSVELGILARQAGDEGCTVREELTRLREKIIALSVGIRDLSHRLHPSELEELGLVSALRSLGDRLFRHEGIRAYFITDDEPLTVPPSSAVAIYRVVQEALRNIVKHSGAKEATVTLESVEDRFRLSIADRGVGFDTEEIGGKAGLGLVSMEERIRLLGGSLMIRSTPDEGTEVEAFVPLPKEQP